MTKKEAFDLIKGDYRALAEILNITPQAVHQWGEEIPLLREYQLREIISKNNAE